MAKKSKVTPLDQLAQFQRLSEKMETEGRALRTLRIKYASFRDAAQYEDQNLLDLWRETKEEFNLARENYLEALSNFRTFLDRLLRDNDKLTPEEKSFIFAEDEAKDGLIIQTFKEASPNRKYGKKYVHYEPFEVFEKPDLAKLGITFNGKDSNQNPPQ
jgi:hypothetical protein